MKSSTEGSRNRKPNYNNNSEMMCVHFILVTIMCKFVRVIVTVKVEHTDFRMMSSDKLKGAA